MANPYESPTTELTLPRPPTSDEIVARLIDGTNTETLAFYDVSDCQIYGRKHRRQLSGSLASAAESAGCFPTVYQTVHWWCLVFMPVWPLAVYFVIPCKECDDPDGDADQYRAIPADWDSRQVAAQYCILLLLLLAVAFGVWWWLW
jgi:hypothetical protein